MSLRRTAYVAFKPPKGVQKRQICKAFTVLCIRAKTVADGLPLLPETESLAERDPPPSKTPISNRYSLVVPEPLLVAKKFN